MRNLFRWGGILGFIVGVISRLNALTILPRSYSWSGDFARSEWGVRLAGFGDVMNIVALLGGMAFLASFTNLFDDQKRA
jgi:hypothetical protein